MTCEMGPGCWVCRMLEKIQVKVSEREGPRVVRTMSNPKTSQLPWSFADDDILAAWRRQWQAMRSCPGDADFEAELRREREKWRAARRRAGLE